MNTFLTFSSEPRLAWREPDPDDRQRMITPLVNLLQQLASVIQPLTDSEYTQKPVGVIESSIGGHVRHCLDHVQSLLAATECGHLDYDHRRRGTLIETSPQSALALIETLVDLLESLSPRLLSGPISVSVTMASDQLPISVVTRVGRELAYVLSHTVHHNAIINAMVKTLGGWVPNRFGYAPSTIKHLEKAQCAR